MTTDFRIDASKPLPDEADTALEGFAPDGDSTDPQGPLCVARKGANGRCWLKYCTAGPNRGCLYDPHTADPGDLQKRKSGTGHDLYEFRQVEARSFDLYMQYLHSGNPAYYRNAMRG